jgi:hypothetical protein
MELSHEGFDVLVGFAVAIRDQLAENLMDT